MVVHYFLDYFEKQNNKPQKSNNILEGKNPTVVYICM